MRVASAFHKLGHDILVNYTCGLRPRTGTKGGVRLIKTAAWRCACGGFVRWKGIALYLMIRLFQGPFDTVFGVFDIEAECGEFVAYQV
jgi:hypothetical protein